MRLIDADAMKESIQSTDTDEKKVLSTKELHRVLVEWIDKRPTIEERKTGKWESCYAGGDDWECCRCSECHEVYDSLAHYNYCPNCGARMGG